MTRRDVIAAVGEGGRTFQIAKRCGVATGVARYHLRALERSGHVSRDARYSSENDIYWRPAAPPPPWFKPLMETFEHIGYARDTDGSPEGRDAQQLDGEAATAGAEGIAQTPPAGKSL